jgi:NAD(P)H-hydrate epimerase
VRRSILPGMLRLTRAQVREIDRQAAGYYDIPGIILMENAARAVVDVAMQMLADVKYPRVSIVCGGGNNGGDGYAVARHLHNRDIRIDVVVAADPERYEGDALTNFSIADLMGLLNKEMYRPPVSEIIVQADLVIDALFGTGLTSPPRDKTLIESINSFRKRVLAIDLPSGMNCDTGEPMGACVKATRTVTFVAEKAGFANPASKEFTGEVTVGDIGCPRELIEEVATMPPP